MDRVPRDGHCSYRCRSRSRKPATAHPHRGGWYVFATAAAANLPLLPRPISTNNSSSLFFSTPCLLLIRLSSAETFSPVLDFCFCFYLTQLLQKHLFWLFPRRCSISTHGMAFWAGGLNFQSQLSLCSFFFFFFC